MTEIETWLREAFESLNLSPARMPPGEAKRIVETARARFVRGSPRAWWLDLAVDCAQYDSTTTTLPQVLPVAAGKVWFIPETEQADLPVYELNVDDLMSVIAECPYFEYYILGSQLDWLVAESDHNVFYVCTQR